MITCRDIYKSFGEKPVLSGIDLEVSDGMIFGLLGPSGAGKTTLIKILTGQLKADSGNARILDKDVNELTGNDRKKIGIMMDIFGVYERLSCRDNLKIYADIFGVSENRINEILRLVCLEEAAKRPARNLSKGMRARLQIARAFLQDPKVLFLDEPTSGLDPTSMRAIHKIILEKKKEGCTIFLTTHNMEEASVLSDKVALLNEGKIVECGEPKEICRKYNHQKKIIIHLSTGKDIEVPHDPDSSGKIKEYMDTGMVETIHSSEPSLETVFLELTGRKIEESA